jgi:hypothetical protein
VRIPRTVRVSVVALVLLIARQAFAQEPERRGFIGLGIGPSTPVGAFAQSSWTNLGDGRTASGYTDTFVNIGYRLREHLGVAGAFSYSEYSMSGGGDDDWYQVAGLTAGPMYSIRLNARAALDLKAMAGLITMTPVVDSYETLDKTGGGLGLDLRAAIRYDVLRRWAVFAEVGVQAANVSFDSGARTDYRALTSGFGVAFRPMW